MNHRGRAIIIFKRPPLSLRLYIIIINANVADEDSPGDPQSAQTSTLARCFALAISQYFQFPRDEREWERKRSVPDVQHTTTPLYPLRSLPAFLTLKSWTFAHIIADGDDATTVAAAALRRENLNNRSQIKTHARTMSRLRARAQLYGCSLARRRGEYVYRYTYLTGARRGGFINKLRLRHMHTCERREWRLRVSSRAQRAIWWLDGLEFVEMVR